MNLAAGGGQQHMRIPTNGAELCAETFGDPADPAVLLVMGAAASMDRWETEFCDELAAAGRYVVRYDHRDTGGSTTYPPGKPGYTADALVSDPVAVLDDLGIERAHLAGMSMGGALVQQIAIEFPDRIRSITLMSTGLATSGGPELPGPSDALREPPPPEPDWSDREATIAYLLEVERPYAGARGLDDAWMRELLGHVYDRSHNMASANNHYAAEGGTEMAYERLQEISVPALVIHGTADPLFALPHGEALQQAIPGAKLLVIEDLGHEVPRWAWDEILPALIAHTGS